MKLDIKMLPEPCFANLWGTLVCGHRGGCVKN